MQKLEAPKINDVLLNFIFRHWLHSAHPYCTGWRSLKVTGNDTVHTLIALVGGR